MTTIHDLGALRSVHRGEPSQLLPLGVLLVVIGLACGAVSLGNEVTIFNIMVTPTCLFGGVLVIALARRHTLIHLDLHEEGFRYVATDRVEHVVLYDTIDRVTLSERSRDGRVPPILRIDLTDAREIALRQDIVKTVPDIARALVAETLRRSATHRVETP